MYVNSMMRINSNAATVIELDIMNSVDATASKLLFDERAESMMNLINFFIFVSQDLPTIYQLLILTN